MPEPLAQVVVRSAAFERNIHTRTHKHRHTHAWLTHLAPLINGHNHNRAVPHTRGPLHVTQPNLQVTPSLEPFQATRSMFTLAG